MPTQTLPHPEHETGPRHLLKLNTRAWLFGSVLVTVLWAVHEWQANGGFARFAHEGNPGDWNPTLPALVILVWALVPGLMALRVIRPRLTRVQFHAAAWTLGMLLLTPLNALIEWQDNGGFERFSRNSKPGSWDPWVLYVGGIWALAAAALIVLSTLRARDRR